MPRTPIPFGPFHGQDTYHEDRADSVFQIGPPGSEAPPARLMQAINVDIKDDGYWRSRSGLTEKIALADCTAVFSGLGMLFVAYGDSIAIIDTNAAPWTATPIVIGLTAGLRVSFLEFASQIWWTNGEVCGRIDADGVPHNWGAVPAAAPTLSASAGTLPEGRYLVAMTITDAAGVEHAAEDSEVITLDADGGITVSASVVLDSNAVEANIYVSGTDQDGLMWAKSVAIGALPTTITALDNDARKSTRPLRTMGMRGPIPADGLFSFMSTIYAFRGKVLFRNNGMWHHIFFPEEHVTVMTSTIAGGVGLEFGIWIVTVDGAWWLSSAEPGVGKMRPLRKCFRKYAKGAIFVEGNRVPAIGVDGRVMLAVSDDGLMVGLPTGEIRPLTQDRLALDVVGKRAEICVRSIDGVRQVVFSLMDE